MNFSFAMSDVDWGKNVHSPVVTFPQPFVSSFVRIQKESQAASGLSSLCLLKSACERNDVWICYNMCLTRVRAVCALQFRIQINMPDCIAFTRQNLKTNRCKV
jgi:hypothetical protein